MTTPASTSVVRRPWLQTAAWAIKGLLALAFLGAAWLKLSGNPHMVAEFAKIGFGQGFRYLTGAIEVLGVALMLWPRSAFVGAAALLCVCVGALIAQIGPLHGDLIHVFVLGGLAAFVAWVNRPGSIA